jgi:ATP-binding cassette subfamily B (MDR/TAP) protein 1
LDLLISVGRVIFAIIVAATTLTSIAPHILQMSKAAAAASELFKVIDRIPSIDSLREWGEKPAECHGEIEFQDIRFSYPSRPDVQVLQDFHLSIPANQTTALVGPSGSGKSTIVALLERWYDPLAGMIRLDGVEINKLCLQWLRTNVRIVQQVSFFSISVYRANSLQGTRSIQRDDI